MLSNDGEAHYSADPSWGITKGYKYGHRSCRTNVDTPKNRCAFLAVPPNHNLASIISNITLFVGSLAHHLGVTEHDLPSPTSQATLHATWLSIRRKGYARACVLAGSEKRGKHEMIQCSRIRGIRRVRCERSAWTSSVRKPIR